MNKTIANGVYPTMITPYTSDGKVDYEAAARIVKWYIEHGCEGVFAVCQSSEMFYLSLEEKIRLAKTVVDAAEGKINVVASGHCSDSLDEQIREINEISKTGIDAFVLVSNRFDLHNRGDEECFKNAQYVLDRIDKDIPLGIYECPTPYKRLLSDDIIKRCLESGRFKFIKDTCCDPELLEKRARILSGTDLKLFNANAQTTLYSLICGYSGYSGIMANFHPDIIVWLCKNFEKYPEAAKRVQEFFTMYAFTECMHYPITAKYHMNLAGVPMELDSRWKNKEDCTEYEKMVIRQGISMEDYVLKQLNNLV